MKREELLPNPDIGAATTVVGTHGAKYPCPDLPAIDRHLRDLCERITHAGRAFPGLVETFRADIDLLLDRRCWLQLSTDSPGARSVPSGPGVAA